MGRKYINSNADKYMRQEEVKKIGPLVDFMVLHDIAPLKLIVMEFHVDYDTVKDLREQKASISTDTIRKFCYIIAHYLHNEELELKKMSEAAPERIEREKLLSLLYESYQQIYGYQAQVALKLIRKHVDLRDFCKP